MTDSSILASIELYQCQLEQVEAALQQDAHNEELCKLKSDLEQVISLQKELAQASSVVSSSKSSNLASSLEQGSRSKKLKEDGTDSLRRHRTSTEPDSHSVSPSASLTIQSQRVTQSNSSAASPSSSSALPGNLLHSGTSLRTLPSEHVDWQLGDSVEVLYTSPSEGSPIPSSSSTTSSASSSLQEGHWYEAMICGMSPDRKVYAITFTKSYESRNVEASKIRRCPATLSAPTKSVLHRPPIVNIAYPKPNQSSLSNSSSSTSNSGAGTSNLGPSSVTAVTAASLSSTAFGSVGKPMSKVQELEKRKKRTQSYVDYLMKKEAEEAHKQKDWKSFQSKLAHQPSPSLFKSKIVAQKSIFATTDGPSAKVGVTNSGKPMTEYQKPKKYK